jgi:hypothetical protein
VAEVSHGQNQRARDQAESKNGGNEVPDWAKYRLVGGLGHWGSRIELCNVTGTEFSKLLIL